MEPVNREGGWVIFVGAAAFSSVSVFLLWLDLLREGLLWRTFHPVLWIVLCVLLSCVLHRATGIVASVVKTALWMGMLLGLLLHLF